MGLGGLIRAAGYTIGVIWICSKVGFFQYIFFPSPDSLKIPLSDIFFPRLYLSMTRKVQGHASMYPVL